MNIPLFKPFATQSQKARTIRQSRLILLVLCTLTSRVRGKLAAATSDSPLLSASDINADFQHLAEQLSEIHPNLYIHRTPIEETRLRTSIESQLNRPMDAVDFYQLVAEYTTFFQDGHTFPSMDFATRSYRASLENNNTVLPIDVDLDRRGFYIKNIYETDSHPGIGARLLSVNGHSSREIISAFQTYYAKPASLFDNAHARLFKEYYWLAFGSSTHWQLRFQHEGREVNETTLEGISMDTFQQRKMSQQSEKNVANQAMFRFHYLDNTPSIAVITIDAMGNFDLFERFLRARFKEIEQRGIKHLVIDIRENGGGSSRLGDELFAYLHSDPYNEGSMQVKISRAVQDWYRSKRQGHPLFDFVTQQQLGTLARFPLPPAIPRKTDHPFEGQCYLLIGPKTYSSGHMLAGLIKCHAAGIVIGQETGQATKTPGDAFSFLLPKSQIGISVSYKLFEGPCEPSTTRGFTPHHFVTYSTDERRTQVDKEMNLVRQLAGQRVRID